MYVMFDAGLRSSELVVKERQNDKLEGGLRLNQIDWNTGKIRIENAKGGKDKYVLLNETALQSVISWLEYRPAGEPDLVFTTLQDRKINNRGNDKTIRKTGRYKQRNTSSYFTSHIWN